MENIRRVVGRRQQRRRWLNEWRKKRATKTDCNNRSLSILISRWQNHQMLCGLIKQQNNNHSFEYISTFSMQYPLQYSRFSGSYVYMFRSRALRLVSRLMKKQIEWIWSVCVCVNAHAFTTWEPLNACVLASVIVCVYSTVHILILNDLLVSRSITYILKLFYDIKKYELSECVSGERSNTKTAHKYLTRRENKQRNKQRTQIMKEKN